MTGQEKQRIYGGVLDPAARNNPRTIIANWVPEASRVLEIGPGNGVIGGYLREEKRCYVVGVEFVPEAAEVAKARFDLMTVGSIEDSSVMQTVAATAPYDAIIFADVLEHLVDPWAVLRGMRPLLSPRGQVLISVPNIAHWTARLNLLLGRFDYTEGYLMDRTHLRWFTWKSAHIMAADCGYAILDEAAIFKPRFNRFWRTFNGYQIVLRLGPAGNHSR